MSDLRKFLADWLDAANGNATNAAWYSNHSGLCENARAWDQAQAHARNSPRAYQELQHRLRTEFKGACIYPFGGTDRFDRDRADGTMNSNKDRIAWVRKVLAETVWGPVIDIDLKPDWLKDTDVCAINQGGAWLGQSGVGTASAWNWFTNIKQIKLLADHAYYTVQRHNDRIGASFTYWGGQGDKPVDYDGGRVLLRTGTTVNNSDDGASWSHPWREGRSGGGDIIGYTRKTLGLTPPSEAPVEPYGALRDILDEAYNQSAKGKGLERHGNGKAWTEQPILAITRDTGVGFPTGQAIKKITEAVGMLGRGESDAAARELLGAIVYTAAAVKFIREGWE
jgi:hypothetical protein